MTRISRHAHTKPGVRNRSGELVGYERTYKAFVKTSDSGLDQTLLELWKRLAKLRTPFFFDADANMAKFTFTNVRGLHICTSTRRFHRPLKTGKRVSATIYLGGYKREFDDPENLLIPCGRNDQLDCSYFGMGEDEADLALFYAEQLVTLKPLKKGIDLITRSTIQPRN